MKIFCYNALLFFQEKYGFKKNNKRFVSIFKPST